MAEIPYDIFLKGEILDLVALNEEIVEQSNWYKWFNDEELMEYSQHHYYPNTKTKQLAFYKSEIENNKSKLQLGIIPKKESKLIGIVSLNGIDFHHRKCEVAGIIGEKEYHNVKFMTEAYRLLLKHAFDELNMYRIYGGTLSKEIALFFCRVFNFKDEGIKRRDVYKNGQYRDVYLIGLLREEYDAGLR